MSSFICSPEHFNSVEKSLKQLYFKDYYFPYKLKYIYPVIYKKREVSVDVFESEITNIIDTLRSLQATCVCLQYKNHYVGTLDMEISNQKQILLYSKKGGEYLSYMQLYKAMQCINYQIETIHLTNLRNLTQDEEHAITFMNEVIQSLAIEIISKLAEYDNAKWHI